MEAIGLVEVTGSSSAIVVVDQMLKTADVQMETWHVKCGGHVTVFISGGVSAVTAAVESVKTNAPCPIVNAAVISGPSEETQRVVNGFMSKKKS